MLSPVGSTYHYLMSTCWMLVCLIIFCAGRRHHHGRRQSTLPPSADCGHFWILLSSLRPCSRHYSTSQTSGLTLMLMISHDCTTVRSRQLPNKHCLSDPMPTTLLKDNIKVLAPFLTDLFNKSLSTGTLPSIFKSEYITPRLKKTDLDTAEAKSYRPISNLTVLSNLLERLVAKQLLRHLDKHKLLPVLLLLLLLLLLFYYRSTIL